jgi:hypothetical protein
MKMKTLAVLAGITAPLIATAGVQAGFVGVTVVSKAGAETSGGAAIFVCNVYANFDNEGNDIIGAVAGTPDQALTISVQNGTFYNTPGAGSDQAPTTFLVGIFPSLAYDSFFSIGVKVVGTAPDAQPADNLILAPGDFPGGLQGASVSTTNWSYAVSPTLEIPPDPPFPNPQADPWDPVYGSGPGGIGSILLGQFSTVDGTGIQGSFVVQYNPDGGAAEQTFVSWEHLIPTPGALGLLGVAGLIGCRRRRRA